MGLFDKIDAPTGAVEKDFVRGAKREPLPTDIYNCMVKYCYGHKSAKGAMGITTVLTTEEGRDIKETQYITSGDAKGNKATYKRKDAKTGKMTEYPLPGFSIVDSMTRLIGNKGILECDTEVKSIPIWDYDKKAEVPTEVEMIIDVVGQPICVAIVKQIQDKRAKSEISGDYEPTGATFTTNVVEKFLTPDERKTLAEVTHNQTADWQESWLTKWKDQVDDKSTAVKSAGEQGAPAATGEAAPKTSLFG